MGGKGLAFIAVLCLFMRGCGHTVYDVDMSVDGDTMHRTIEVSFTGTHPAMVLATQPATRPSTSPGERQTHSFGLGDTPPGTQPAISTSEQAIETIYNEARAARSTGPVTSQPYSADFIGQLPADLGGAGQVIRYESSLGSAWIYLERLRADQDPATTLETRLQAADLAAKLIAGWSRSRLGDRKDFDKLGKYLDGDFRKDLRTLSLYLWMLGAARHMSTADAATSQPSSTANIQAEDLLTLSTGQSDVALAIAQFLFEHKYIDPQDVPTIAREIVSSLGGIGRSDDKADQARVQLIKRLWVKFLTRKVGLTDKELINHLGGLLDDPKRIKEANESLAKYLKESKELKQFLDKHFTDAKKPAEDAGPEILKSLLSTALQPGGVNFLNTDDEIHMKLALAGPPVVTNGVWDAKTSRIVWHRRVQPGAGDPIPAICYAAWSKSDDAFQKKHFGRVILTGQKLLGYSMAIKALTPAEAKEWDGLVNSLTSQNAVSELVAFARSRDPKKESNLGDVVGLLAESIAKELEEATSRPAAPLAPQDGEEK